MLYDWQEIKHKMTVELPVQGITFFESYIKFIIKYLTKLKLFQWERIQEDDFQRNVRSECRRNYEVTLDENDCKQNKISGNFSKVDNY